MTQDDSKEHKGGEETRRDESGEGNGEEKNREEANEHEQLIYETDGGYERETPKDDSGKTHAHGDKQQELREDEIHKPRELKWEPTCGNTEVGNGVHKLLEGEDYRVQEPNNGTTHPAPPRTANEAANSGLCEHTRFDWAMETNQLISPIPNASDFRPTKPQSPFASPKPTPHLFSHLIPPLQPVHMTPKGTVIQQNGNMAPHTCIPAMDVPSTTPPQVPVKRAPTAIIHSLHDLSTLHSGTLNPWASLRHCHNGHYAHVPCQFTC